jgi:hypothetical protein
MMSTGRAAYCFCSAGFEKWVACLRTRKLVMRIAKIDAAPAMMIERLCHVKLPMMFWIARDIGQY